TETGWVDVQTDRRSHGAKHLGPKRPASYPSSTAPALASMSALPRSTSTKPPPAFVSTNAATTERRGAERAGVDVARTGPGHRARVVGRGGARLSTHAERRTV